MWLPIPLSIHKAVRKTVQPSFVSIKNCLPRRPVTLIHTGLDVLWVQRLELTPRQPVDFGKHPTIMSKFLPEALLQIRRIRLRKIYIRVTDAIDVGSGNWWSPIRGPVKPQNRIWTHTVVFDCKTSCTRRHARSANFHLGTFQIAIIDLNQRFVQVAAPMKINCLIVHDWNTGNGRHHKK